jgi:hypothetical protein
VVRSVESISFRQSLPGPIGLVSRRGASETAHAFFCKGSDLMKIKQSYCKYLGFFEESMTKEGVKGMLPLGSLPLWGSEGVTLIFDIDGLR